MKERYQHLGRNGILVRAVWLPVLPADQGGGPGADLAQADVGLSGGGQ